MQQAQPRTTPFIILIVSGDVPLREQVSQQLKELGHSVFDATSGQAASVALRVCDPYLVVVDGGLPDTDGLSWVRARRESGDRRRMVFMSPTSLEVAPYVVLTHDLGVERVVQKPIEASTLALLIDDVLTQVEVSPPPPPPESAVPALRSISDEDDEETRRHGASR
jgi:DNA-binding response OmpR family regulator